MSFIEQVRGGSIEQTEPEEKIFLGLMLASVLVVMGSLILIVTVIVLNGAPSLSLQILTQTSEGGFYLGASGGFLNAIVGSLLLSLPATGIAFLAGVAIALYLQKDFIIPVLQHSFASALTSVGGSFSRVRCVLPHHHDSNRNDRGVPSLRDYRTDPA